MPHLTCTTPKRGHAEPMDATNTQNPSCLAEVFLPPPIPNAAKRVSWSETHSESLAISEDDDYPISHLVGPRKNTEWWLGQDFTPGPWDFICGRSKKNLDHIGNRRVRLLVASKLHEYVHDCRNAKQKSRVVRQIVQAVYTCGGFVRRDDSTGDWYNVGMSNAHEKVGHLFRDNLKKMHRPTKNTKKKTTKTKPKSLSLAQCRDSLLQSVLTMSSTPPPASADEEIPSCIKTTKEEKKEASTLDLLQAKKRQGVPRSKEKMGTGGLVVQDKTTGFLATTKTRQTECKGAGIVVVPV